MRLTDKDILLLKLAFCILIVFLMVRFLIMPGLGQYQENRMESQELDEALKEMQSAIDGIPGLEKKIEEREGELEGISVKYYDWMENRQIDELLTGLALKAELFPVSLSIGEAQPEIPETYVYGRISGEEGEADKAGETDKEAESDNPENDQDIGQEGAAADGYILTVNCTMVLQGSSIQIYHFIDDIAHNYPAIQIRTMSVSERTYLDTEWNVVEQPEVTFELAVYMHDNIDK
ncbi:hypothetical protein [Sporofaciens musculi]|uniref:hypothetical protein n=1 Tax=Sporofaciens musculi TaxID=2681861 RepID=UPI00259D2460|nr:hypothetical protein [Sporofaciens musculi]